MTGSKTSYPICDHVNYSNLSREYECFLSSIFKLSEPTYYKQAKTDDNWINAMQEEIKALEENKTWSLVPLSIGKKSIGCKQVIKIKHRSDGTIERYKTSLVSKGYNQTEGIDYTETFSPVVKIVTVRIVLGLNAIQHWPQ